MSKILVKSPVKNNKVLVKATVTSGGMDDSAVQYDLTGKPVFVMGGGKGATGKTAAQKYLARLGGAAGAATAALGLGGGQKRTLGEFVGSGIGGGYQGADLGNRLGNFLSTGTQREVANLKESQKKLNNQRAAYRKLGLPIPAELGGERSGPVRVQSSDPYEGMRGGGDDEMDATNAQAANTILSTIQDAKSGTKIEPESEVAVTDNSLPNIDTALASLAPGGGGKITDYNRGQERSSQSMFSNAAVEGLGLNTQQVDPMDDSPLLGNLGASSMAPPSTSGAASQLAEVDSASNQNMAQHGMDDERSITYSPEQIEAAKNLMDRQQINHPGDSVNWNQSPNPNQKASADAARRMDAYGNFQDMANWDEEYDIFDDATWKMLKAFRLLKMLTFYPRYIRKGLVLVE